MRKVFIFIILIIILSPACKKKQPCPTFWGYQLPYDLFFVIKQNGQRLPDSILNNLRLSYYESGSKKYVSDFSRASSDGYNLGIVVTQNVGFLSGDSSIKNYYIEYPNGNMDTLYVDYHRLTGCEADTSSCGCLYPRYAVKYNGRLAAFDTTIKLQTVYLFNK